MSKNPNVDGKIEQNSIALVHRLRIFPLAVFPIIAVYCVRTNGDYTGIIYIFKDFR